MNILLDLLPETVEIGGVEYPINTDFRISVLFELMMQDNTISDEDKILEAINLYYPQTPDPEYLDEAVEKLIWFYRCGNQDKTKKRKSEADEDNTEEEKLVYSFEHDDRYIYAAFVSEYGIDLQDIEDLHWWKFRALLTSLSDECEFKKIMGYRSVTITSTMSPEQRSFYEKMKRIHALPMSEAEQDKYDRITQALMGDGDLEGLL
ncbi:bacteriophage Gp15 protein [Faecalimonas umbilicata]|uniref:Bacteriophage Gp15 protein n=1 Tax=Faecalimonas umbilicata TaxID=1912855 RepID=A0A4R3JH87_9FIRM|nr:bacteriophage Gp15 family protein [Faecalimonas umbilicata]TCS65509.1 bacteriophage Gp15 protein [Faecalimonas umbilicata]GBU06584.1 hypothetical protein FAEUMB_31250 [Faecalimonas umbilicata]